MKLNQDFDAKFAQALLEQRQIFVGEFLKGETSPNIKKAVLYLNALNDRDITLLINSPGGDSGELVTLCEIIHHSKAKVIGRVIGKACSAAAVLLQACQVREMTGNSTINPHLAIGIPIIQLTAETDLSALNKRMKGMKKSMVEEQKVYDKIFALRMNKSVEEVRKILIADATYKARIALQLGLVDRLV